MKIKKILSKFINFVSFFIPKSKKIWVYGAWGGKSYSDNSKYVFEYANSIKTKERHVWITADEQISKELRSKNYKAYHRQSLKGLWYIMRAKVAICTEGVYDISWLVGKKTKIIQLWHGMGSKAMRWKATPETAKAMMEERASWCWISTSDLYTENISNLLCVPKQNFVITGYPRNDALVRKCYHSTMEELREKYKNHKFVIYMPTHRNFGKEGNKHINIEELRRVDEQLGEKNIVMVYKPHIHELENFVEYENDFSNIVLAKDQNVWGDVYSYINYFDLLISDYSSILTDFMCTGKPVVLFPYDIEDYQSGDAGLTDFFYDLAGGPMGYTWDEVLEYTCELLKNDTWKEERERCRKIYHFYNDGSNSQRVYEMIKNILKTK